VGLLSDQQEKKIKTLSFSKNGTKEQNFEYYLAGSPCEDVIGKVIKPTISGVSNLFPNDLRLVRLSIEGYWRASLCSIQSCNHWVL